MNISEFLKKTPESRKIFGAREIKIIEKQINGISLTQSEKNRLSRDIRKKLQFIKEFSKFEEEFNLKKGIENKKLVEEALRIILEHSLRNKIERIFLFGSVVKNEVTVKSDIDIAVKFQKISLREATKFRINISGKVSDKIDIQVFNVLPEKIKREINKNGKVLFTNDKG